MALYLVTGGAGFIGSNIALHILQAGGRVRVLDDLSTGRRENLRGIIGDIDFHEATVCDPAACAKACAGADFVLHQAALGSVPRSIEDPVASNEANVTGTVNMLAAARDAGVQRFVCAGSSSVYGDAPGMPRVESIPPRPMSPYAVTKLTQELYNIVFHRVYGLPTVVLRYFNVYGPRQDPHSAYAAVIPRFASALLTGGKAVIYGDGMQTRDFTFIEDCVQANMLACSAPDGASGRAYNIACGKQTSIIGVYETLKGLLGGKGEPSFEPPRAGDPRDSLADITAAQEALGYSPQYDISAGLAKTAQWYRSSLA